MLAKLRFEIMMLYNKIVFNALGKFIIPSSTFYNITSMHANQRLLYHKVSKEVYEYIEKRLDIKKVKKKRCFYHQERIIVINKLISHKMRLKYLNEKRYDNFLFSSLN